VGRVAEEILKWVWVHLFDGLHEKRPNVDPHNQIVHHEVISHPCDTAWGAQGQRSECKWGVTTKYSTRPKGEQSKEHVTLISEHVIAMR
jgi:hypothetical protein